METLEELFKDEPRETVETGETAETEEATAEAAETEEVEAKPEESEEVEAKAEPEPETEDPAPPAEVERDTEKVPLQALMAERDKRQELERKLQELESDKKPAETPDIWENPEEFVTSKIQEVERRALSRELERSEMRARQAHPDFDEAVEIFGKMVQQSPDLRQKMIASLEPGEYVYRTAMQFKELSEAGGNLDVVREKIRAEVRAEMEAEAKEKHERAEKIPASLTDEQSKGGDRAKAKWSEKPLEEIFPNQF